MRDSPAGLAWIDGFIDSIRPYVRVRLTDNVVIRMPNEAFKVNRSGARTLHYLLEGGRIATLTAGVGNEEMTGQLTSFFSDLSRMLGGGICDDYSSPTVHRTPFSLGYIELPILSEVALTWRCNLCCRFCYAACQHVSEAPAHDELDTAAMKRVLKIIRDDAEVPSVSFTGGEPLLRPDLPDLIHHAHTLGMRVNLITNGTLIDAEGAALLKEAGLASAQVSLESPDPRVHDRIVGQSGAHAASVAGLQALHEAGVHVHPHTTFCRLNLATVTALPSFARSLGTARFSANLVIPAGRGSDPALALTYEEVAQVLPEVMAAARAEGVRFMWYSPTPACVFNPVKHGLGNKGCAACEGLLSVDPAGSVLPCSSWREPLGSLLEEGFRPLWFGARARHIRAKREAPAACRTCEDFALCQGACPLYFQAHDCGEIEPALTCIARSSL